MDASPPCRVCGQPVLMPEETYRDLVALGGAALHAGCDGVQQARLRRYTVHVTVTRRDGTGPPEEVAAFAVHADAASLRDGVEGVLSDRLRDQWLRFCAHADLADTG